MLSSILLLSLTWITYLTNLDIPLPMASRQIQEEQAQVTIQSPLPGQVLQGIVPIIGSTAVQGFQSTEISFGYTNNPTLTWFLIHHSRDPLPAGTLTQWDTSTITDGNYDLRLIVTLTDGSQIDVVVPGLRVRNYSPIETDTPTPVTPTATQVPGDTPIPTITPSPTLTSLPPTLTPLPTNPAELSSTNLLTSVGKGAITTLVTFLLLGLYITVRKFLRR